MRKTVGNHGLFLLKNVSYYDSIKKIMRMRKVIEMERTVMLSHGDMRIPCNIYEPGFYEVEQVIIGVHGFSGDKNSSVLKAVAEEMFFYKSAMITFDFPGHGESNIMPENMTLRGCRECLMAVAEYARELYPGVTRFALFASSFGAYVSLLCMDELTEKLGRLKTVMRSPSVRMSDSFLKMARNSEEDFLKKGRVDCGYGRRMEISYSFYEDLRGNNAMADYDMPMMVLHGELDDVVRMEDIEYFRLLNAKSRLVVLPDAGHHLNSDFETDMIVDLSRDWYLCEEVLLCEYK